MDTRTYPEIPGQSNSTITAHLFGSDICTALGFAVQSPSPVLTMCRKLVGAGYDPILSLWAYRNGTLCLTVRSIGEGAGLRIGGQGVGFLYAPERAGGAPVEFDGENDPEPSDGGEP